MSHYAKLAVQFLQRNEQQMVSALRKTYGQDGVEVHTDAVELKTYFDKDASTQQDDFYAEPCHIVVRREAQKKQLGSSHMAFNDAGFKRLPNGGYAAFVDEAGMPQATLGLVSQEYALLVAEKELRAKGYASENLRRIQLEDNSIRLEAVRIQR